MPYVNIKLANDHISAEQKAMLIKDVTDLLVTKLGKNPASVFVIIEEVDTDNWGIGGQSVTEKRKADK